MLNKDTETVETKEIEILRIKTDSSVEKVNYNKNISINDPNQNI